MTPKSSCLKKNTFLSNARYRSLTAMSYLQAYTCVHPSAFQGCPQNWLGKQRVQKRATSCSMDDTLGNKSRQVRAKQKREEEKKHAQLNHRRWNRPLAWLHPEWGCIHLIKGGLNYPGKNNRTERDGLGSSDCKARTYWVCFSADQKGL